jgi:hypothetical protein
MFQIEVGEIEWGSVVIGRAGYQQGCQNGCLLPGEMKASARICRRKMISSSSEKSHWFVGKEVAAAHSL